MYPLPQHITRPAFDLISPFLALPFIRAGFWPLHTTLDSGNFPDWSPHGRTLTNNGATVHALYNAFVGYADLDGTDDYLSRADEAGLDRTGSLTLGGWFWMDVLTATSGLIGKWNETGNQRSYLVFFNNADDTARFIVSSDGTATTSVTGSVLAVNRWHFIVGRYNPSTETAVFVNGVKLVNTTSIPASIFAGTADFLIGSYNAGGNLLNGRAALCFMCDTNHSDIVIQSIFQQTRGFFDV